MSPSKQAIPLAPAQHKSRSVTPERKAPTPPTARSLPPESRGEKRTDDVSPSPAPHPVVVAEDRVSVMEMEAVSILAGMWVEARRMDAAEAEPLAGVQVAGTAPTAARALVQGEAEETEDEAVAAPQAAAARPAMGAAARSKRGGKVQDPFHNYSQENPPPKVKRAEAKRKASEAAAAAREGSGSAAAAGPSRMSVAPPRLVAGPSRQSSGSSSVAGPSRKTSGGLSAATDVTVPELVRGTRKRSVEAVEEKEEEGEKKTRSGRTVKKPKWMDE